MAVFSATSPPDADFPEQPDGVPWPTDGWPTGPPDSAIADRLDRLLAEAFPRSGEATDRFGLSLAFAAVKGGRLVAERYGPTAGPDEQLISWSMAKSVTQTLVGVLVADGRLDVEQPAPVAEWSGADDPRRTITLDHLLRMVPGTTFNEDYIDDTTSHCLEMLFGQGQADMGAYTAALPAASKPDTVFNYSSGTTNVISRILADRVGRGPDFERWMHEVLLGPLGASGRLTFDDAGTWVGSSYLHATARDFAKFGLLNLRGGTWDGHRIVDRSWVDYARTPRGENDEGSRYGAHWWIWGPDERVFYAAGYETQRIIVDPTSDVVLVRLGKTPTELADNVDEWLERVRRLLAGLD